ncbi:hypothetical protein IIF46_003256 [Salmonella enterica]|nr:hypothetical protein [Salmonella enterica]
MEAVRRGVERGHSVSGVATCADITTRCLYVRIKMCGTNQEQSDTQAELRRLQKEQRRGTD